jgi:uroporphyrinogen-III decarboxylase
MATYTVVAMTEPRLFHRLLERYAAILWPQTEAVAQALPGRLWRICGPEYASPPYLPPRLFREYVVRYDTPMVQAIQQHGGFARIHSHGRLRAILDDIAATGCVGLDPIEPPPQGDVELAYVRERYGRQMVLFGNLEASDIENLPTDAFEGKVCRALREGTAGDGRGFVLMPSACPYGRVLSSLALANYRKMVEVVEDVGAVPCACPPACGRTVRAEFNTGE